MAGVVRLSSLPAIHMARSQIHAPQEATESQDADDHIQFGPCDFLGVHGHRGA